MEELLDRIEQGLTTVEDAEMVRSLLAQPQAVTESVTFIPSDESYGGPNDVGELPLNPYDGIEREIEAARAEGAWESNEYTWSLFFPGQPWDSANRGRLTSNGLWAEICTWIDKFRAEGYAAGVAAERERVIAIAWGRWQIYEAECDDVGMSRLEDIVTAICAKEHKRCGES